MPCVRAWDTELRGPISYVATKEDDYAREDNEAAVLVGVLRVEQDDQGARELSDVEVWRRPLAASLIPRGRRLRSGGSAVLASRLPL